MSFRCQGVHVIRRDCRLAREVKVVTIRNGHIYTIQVKLGATALRRYSGQIVKPGHK